MKSNVANGLDSKYNRMQWAGEEYLLAELEDSAKLTKSDAVYDKEVLYWIASGTLIPERIVKKSTSKPLPKP